MNHELIKEHQNPFDKFATWFNFAKNSKLVKDHTAFTLSTCNIYGEPDLRIVLLKELKEDGFVFFTNQNSSKGMDLSLNQSVAACFYWDRLNLQIRIKGKAFKTNQIENDAYFASRSFASRIGACVSKQSSYLKSRDKLLEEYSKMALNYGLEIDKSKLDISPESVEEIDILKNEFSDKIIDQKPIVRPLEWGGFLIKPTRFEFWINGRHRLHDRTVYELKNNAWNSFKIYP
jgi:pyridoxamine 5'-phosphate oxidase